VSKILVVDDDKNLLEVLRYNLVKESYTVITAEDGVQALELARRHKPDLTILDIMLPGLDGLEVCRILRKEIEAPILMLTAKAEEVDKVVGLELGADDYMTKPFSIRELMARLRAMLRRSQRMEQQTHPSEQDIPSVLKAGSLEIDTVSHRVSRNGLVLSLSPKEFDLLSFLVRNRGQVFSREVLVEKLWGYSHEGTGRTVDVHIRWLRRKIEDNPQKPEHLLTVHGFGYKFEG
jgi:two-component system OmpR family response regulator